MKETNAALMRLPQRFRPLLAVLALLSLGGLAARAAEPPAGTNGIGISHHADELLRRTSDYLSQSPFFSVNAEVWQDAVMASGQRVQATRTVDLQVRRPNRLRAELRSTRRNRGIWYDGKTVSILDRNRGTYGTVAAPNNLDEMLDSSLLRFGIAIPLEDLIESNPYAEAKQKVSSGTDIGPTTVLGVPCEHLAFSQTNIDWQIWIEDGPRPVPRKIVIIYKDEEGSPQYTALLNNWDFETKLPEFVFKFEPPPGAAKVNVMELGPQNRNQQSKKEE
ncbi:MAG TPA: DUF2092 domain-containing protein [Verrucomicrobiae bacterium]|nr:DUF2092 domain-containing protein [Verrucomicrobiae bacterium]